MRIYFVGIKGSGMSALALFLNKKGHYIEGSDINEYVFTEDLLIENGIKIHSLDSEIIDGFDLVIVGNSFERSYKNQINYVDAINLFVDNKIISVAGTHGKTTTSTFLSTLLNSSYIIGDGRGDYKASKYTVLESCEYKATFLGINSSYILITSIDLDHVDYFNNIEEVIELFKLYTYRANKVVMCGDKNKFTNENIITYGFNSNNDVVVKVLEYNDKYTLFTFYYYGKEYKIKAAVFGKHNVLNLVGALVMCFELGEFSVIHSIDNLFMPKLRFNEEFFGTNIIITDYAHHPNEILATLNAVEQKYLNRNLFIVFQFHTYTRLNFFLKEFKEIFENGHFYLTPVFSSNRESDNNDYNYDELVNGLMVRKFEDLPPLNTLKNSLIIFMGAGNIYEYKKNYVNTCLKRFHLL